MNIAISAAHNMARLAGSLEFLATGSGATTLDLYDGEQPTLGAEATGALIATITLDTPPGAIVSGALVLAATNAAMVLVSGTPTWARCKSSAGEVAFDCDVSGPSGGGAVQLTSVPLYAGGLVRLSSVALS
jgi:hypothetical protein